MSSGSYPHQDGRLRLVVPGPTWEDHLHRAFDADAQGLR